MTRFAVPPGLARSGNGDATRTAWLDALPATIAMLSARWSLEVDRPFADPGGSAAWVAPVRLPDGGTAVLKVALPHFEGLDEIRGLRFWAGAHTVRLLAADEAASAMLLERCEPGLPLRDRPEPEQDAVLASLLTGLWRAPRDAPAATFRPLATMLAHWAEETRAQEAAWPDRALVEEGLATFDQLVATTTDPVVLFTDLHAGNVLSARRAPWLAIDPKPFVGDAAYDATQHLLNGLGRMRAAPRATIDAFADRLGVSRERVRLWTFARAAAQPRDDWSTSPWLAVAKAIGGERSSPG